MKLTGYLLKLDASSWNNIEKRARTDIRKANRHLKVRWGDLDELRALHWNPAYLPHKLSRNQRIYTATYQTQPIACILITLLPEKKLITYSYAGFDSTYKQYNGNSLLIWNLVNLYGGRFDYLDLGGSTKKGISRFKKQFATENYQYRSSRSIQSRLKFRIYNWLPYRVHRTLQLGGRLQRLIGRIRLNNITKHPSENKIVHIACDDFSKKTKPNQIEPLETLNKRYPEFRVTLFTIPYGLEEDSWQVELLKHDWVDIGIHGYRHTSSELWDRISNERARNLIQNSLSQLKSLGLSSQSFKPPRFRCRSNLYKILEEYDLKHGFLTNNQHEQLTNENTTPKKTSNFTLFPTNYSIWHKDPSRLNPILENNGYLSIQTHTKDFPRHQENLDWIINKAIEHGGYRFEQFD